MFRILFSCTTGAGRSVMAAAFAKKYSTEDIEITYIGDRKRPVNPLAIKVMSEIGIDIPMTVQYSVEDVTSIQYDAVVTLCEQATEQCPHLPGSPVRIHWNLADPLELADTPEEQVAYYRQLRDSIHDRVHTLFKYGSINAMIELRSTFNLLLNNMTDGVMAHDHKRRIFYFNEAAQNITGYQYSDVIGKDCHEIFPGGFCNGLCRLCSESASSLEKNRFSTIFDRKDGATLDLDLSSVSVKSHPEEEPGVMIIFRDLTEMKRLRKKAELDRGFLGIIGQAPSMQKIFHSIRNLADVNVPILIQGESGTGKEMVANALHTLSSRASKPFVPVNCGALPEGTLESELFGHVKGAFTSAIRDKKGRFELAHGGTIFLDEIADIPLPTQVKLLRVLQERNFVPVGGEKNIYINVRVICACNTNLKSLVDRGLFREDLYYRLAVVPIDLPPLRERNGDITLLVYHFIEKFSSELGKRATDISEGALSKLTNYSWYGNVRELANVIHYATIQCQGASIELKHLPPEVRDHKHTLKYSKPGRPPKITSDDVVKALEKTNGNQSKAAKMLGVNRATIYRIIKKSNVVQNT